MTRTRQMAAAYDIREANRQRVLSLHREWREFEETIREKHLGSRQ